MGWGLSPIALFTGQHQQLRVRGERLAHGILKFTACLDLLLDFLDPFLGDALGASFPTGHETSDHAAWPLPGARAGGLPTAGVIVVSRFAIPKTELSVLAKDDSREPNEQTNPHA